MKTQHTINFDQRNTSGPSINVRMTFDYTGCTDDEILEWASRNRAIAVQRANEKQTAEWIRDNLDGKTVHARSAGKQIKSREQIEREMETSMANMTSDEKREYLESLIDKLAKQKTDNK